MRVEGSSCEGSWCCSIQGLTWSTQRLKKNALMAISTQVITAQHMAHTLSSRWGCCNAAGVQLCCMVLCFGWRACGERARTYAEQDEEVIEVQAAANALDLEEEHHE